MANNIKNIVSVIIFLIMSLVTNTMVMAAGDGLKAYYWNFAVADNNNQFPSGNPNLNRIEAVVDNNWQLESPATSINADKFAVRWQGSIEINETGKYVFHTQSDDGIRLWIDNQLIINNWTLHVATWNNSADIELIAGTRYDIKMEFFEHTGHAVARLHWQTPSNNTRRVIPTSQLYSTITPMITNVTPVSACSISDEIFVQFNTDMKTGNANDSAEGDQNYSITSKSPSELNIVSVDAVPGDPSKFKLTFNKALDANASYTIEAKNIVSAANIQLNPNPSSFTFTASASGLGLNANYWNFNVAANSYLFPTTAANLTGIDAVIDNSWGTSSPAPSISTDNFAVRWQGFVQAPTTGIYMFSTYSDDGVRLWVDDQLIIDNWTLHGPTINNSPSISLIAGQKYSIKMEFFEHTGGAVARLLWTIPSSSSRTIIPSSALFSCANDDANIVAQYHLDESQWGGTIVQVLDTSGNNHHGTAKNGALSAQLNPAISGNPGSCGYGQFDGDNDYIELPNFPNLTGSFTITAWIKSDSENTNRIFVDDDNNIGGYALSLGDPGEGRLRFFSRKISPISLDTGNVISNKNQWYFVTAVHDVTTKQRFIYVDGNLEASGTYTGTWGTDPGMASIGGETNASNEGVTFASFNGNIDEVQVFESALNQSQIRDVMKETHPCTVYSKIDHFELFYPGNALTCSPAPITIKACANSDCSSLYSENVTVTLTPATRWVTNPVTFSSGSTVAYLSQPTPANVIIDVNASSIVPQNNIQCFSNTILDPGCSITFADAGFVFDVPTLTACKPSADITIKAVKKSDTSVQCVDALTGNQTLNFWSDYLSPNTGSKSAVISGTKIKQSSPGTPVNITFNKDGEATFTVQYDDAGQLQLDASFDDGNGLTLKGSDVFVSKPEALIAYSNDANAECSSHNANCSKFKKAGESFNLKVNAACWTHDGDSDFTDNPVTPNFELSSIVNTHNLLAPASGSTGTLSNKSFNFTSSDNGSHTVSQTLSEVGVFEFGIIAPSYFGETLTTVVSPAIGRFYPDHFELKTQSNGSFGAHACTGFSYSGQHFSYQTSPQLIVTAYSALDPATITQNYTGDFAKLTIADFAVTPPTTDANQLGADTTNRVRLLWMPDAPDLTDNANGTLTFAFGNDSYSYLHQPNSKIDEFTNAVDLTFTAISDSDNVDAYQLPYTLQPTGETIRFGRFAISSAHGSELAPLVLSLTAEYFNGINWVTNSADQCTTLSLSSDLQLATPHTAGGSWQAGNSTMTIANGTTRGLLANNAPLLNGIATLTLSAPGEDNEGYVDVRSQLSITAPWLLGDYDNDGHYDDNPTGRASFGLFKGSDNIIFRREVY